LTGTALNVAAILVGGTLGSLLGDRLPPRLRETVMHGMALVVLVVGMDMALGTENVLIVLGSIVAGGILGEWWQLERRLDSLARWVEARAARVPFLARGEFSQGLVSASLLFCVGPMAILGSMEDGLRGDYSLLAIKSVLDGFTSLAFGAALGMGVTFAALAVLLVQGGVTLGASLLEGVLSEAMIAELTATGGVMMLGLGLLMLELKHIRVANLLPALVLAPILVALWAWAGLP
jgi:uncharacterized membrane protein YqgA involved in biofilm formation